jgi:hypothetical protein
MSTITSFLPVVLESYVKQRFKKLLSVTRVEAEGIFSSGRAHSCFELFRVGVSHRQQKQGAKVQSYWPGAGEVPLCPGSHPLSLDEGAPVGECI